MARMFNEAISYNAGYYGKFSGQQIVKLQMNLKLYQVLILLSCLLIFGCGRESKNAIAKYSGDGEIQYIPSPALLGADGIEIKFQEFDLSQNFKGEYTLTNLPHGTPYTLYLVVPTPAPLNDIKNSTLRMKVLNNGAIEKDLTMPIKNMWNSSEPKFNRFYYSKSVNKNEVSSRVPAEQDSNYSIEVSYENGNVKEKVFGYFLLSRGGFK